MEDDGQVPVIPVYEGEILDEYQYPDNSAAIVKRNARPPVEKRAYRMGKAAGALISALGVINEIRYLFKRNRGGGEAGECGYGRGTGRGFGRGAGRGTGRRKRRWWTK